MRYIVEQILIIMCFENIAVKEEISELEKMQYIPHSPFPFPVKGRIPAPVHHPPMDSTSPSGTSTLLCEPDFTIRGQHCT
jgi:hypothetical protein